MNIKRILLAAVLLILQGCVVVPPYQIGTQEVQQGYFVSKDYKIVANDGSFEIKGGETFIPPFQNDMYGCSGCEGFYLNNFSMLLPENLLFVGGRKVTVIRGSERLNGILVLNRVFTANSPSSKYPLRNNWKYSSPALRSYELKISDAQFNGALEGRVKVAYEIFAQLPAASSVTKRSREAYSWVLMMSRNPL